MERQIILYDTTLRDGTQGEQVDLSAEDKLRIGSMLDGMGIPYVEAGWPGTSPRDDRLFEMAACSPFACARLTAFGSTRRAGVSLDEDPLVQALVHAGVGTLTIFGKSWDLHVREFLGIGLEENLSLIEDTVGYLKDRGFEVLYDAEHFFDGYKWNQAYALETLFAAERGGADFLVLCDTNGGTLPGDITAIVRGARERVRTPLGIHTHNDCGLALANTLAAVESGAVMVQGTINGYGERCGNADLISVIATLQLKMGYRCLPEDRLRHLTELSRFVSEIANVPPSNQSPFVGRSAFAHKAGVHVNAVMKSPGAYEHLDPEAVGNRRRILVSDLSGKSTIEHKSQEMGIRLGGESYDSRRVLQRVKELEAEGFRYEAAEGSLELLIKRVTGQFEDPFVLESFRVTIEKNREGLDVSRATIKISVGDEIEMTAAEGDGPVSALDHALRKALTKFYPEIQEMGLVDFKVRVIDGSEGTGAKVRVQIESRDAREIWSTVGVSKNIIEASWQALADSVQVKLSRGSAGEGVSGAMPWVEGRRRLPPGEGCRGPSRPGPALNREHGRPPVGDWGG